MLNTKLLAFLLVLNYLNLKINVYVCYSIEEKKRFNYVFYDPEMHWCQSCDVFPKTAKDYLNHLHSKEHMDRDDLETPWHSNMINDVSVIILFHLFFYSICE